MKKNKKPKKFKTTYRKKGANKKKVNKVTKLKNKVAKKTNEDIMDVLFNNQVEPGVEKKSGKEELTILDKIKKDYSERVIEGKEDKTLIKIVEEYLNENREELITLLNELPLQDGEKKLRSNAAAKTIAARIKSRL